MRVEEDKKRKNHVNKNKKNERIWFIGKKKEYQIKKRQFKQNYEQRNVRKIIFRKEENLKEKIEKH